MSDWFYRGVVYAAGALSIGAGAFAAFMVYAAVHFALKYW